MPKMSTFYKTIKVFVLYLVKDMEYKSSIGAGGGRLRSIWGGRTHQGAPHASAAYITTCGLTPSSVRSYLRAQEGDSRWVSVGS